MAIDILVLPIVAVASSSWLSRILLIWEFTQFEAGAILPADSDLKEDVTMPVDSELFETSAGKHMVSPGVMPLNHPSAATTRRKSENVLRLKADGRSTDDIAREAGVSRATVTRILRYVERAAAS
ncbi:LacI family DNA-binding transcriptional regulator [Rhizobium sp. P40RR-XXII]|uniref:helix-turn-helix domain-containing protein n=1 Tax=Rhizobium sp. P40RR-XXII TaxID=2726739 RepID=UPI0014573AFD|nr:helix-turn-helix domain-containing protein [Rhizobium sp. P40RR-XXII]NLS17593.1 LacI family DNA-binding transcriptional regulator [Rhizobium sp. P40RR-XXII]